MNRPLRLVSANSNRSSHNSAASPIALNHSWWKSPKLPPVVRKVWRLHQLRPKACAVIEKLVDELLEEIEKGLL